MQTLPAQNRVRPPPSLLHAVYCRPSTSPPQCTKSSGCRGMRLWMCERHEQHAVCTCLQAADLQRLGVPLRRCTQRMALLLMLPA